MGARQTTLVSIAPSNYVEKARWALQLAKIPFVEEKHMPLLAYASTVPKGGKSVPLLAIPSQRLALTDSADILDYCAKTSPSLYPNETVKEMELFYDNKLGPHARRLAYYLVFHDSAVAKRVLLGSLDSWVEYILGWLFLPVFRIILCKALRVDKEHAAISWTKVQGILKDVEDRLANEPIGSKHLAASTFSAADIAFCAHMSLLLFPTEHKYLSPYISLDEVPVEYRAQLKQLRESRVGQYVSWCYKHKRPPMLLESKL